MENHDGVNPEVIQEVYHRTEVAFVDYVRTNWQRQPQLALVGSCCLVGVVFNNVLYVANAGDSRAVLARWPNEDNLEDGDNLEVIQLSVDYNANDPAIRDEVSVEHPSVSNLFIEAASGCFYIRGCLQPTRAIGDVYLKHNEFNRAPLDARYRQEEPIAQPIVKAEPTVQTCQLGPDDKFVIFASDGLWDEMNNLEAAAFVKENPRDGAAARLLRKALDKAARKHEMEYNDLRYVKPGDKRQYHDDISIVIVFFDNLEAPALPPPENPPIDVDNTEAPAPPANPPIPVDSSEAPAPAPPANPPIPVDNLEAPTPPPQANPPIPVDNMEAPAAAAAPPVE